MLTKNMEADMLVNIRCTPAKVLTEKQREFYFENGYILLEKFLTTIGSSGCALPPRRWSIAAGR